MATLNSILLDSASYLDLDATLPTGTELTTRIRFATMAVNEWAKAYKWRQLKTEGDSSFGSYDSIEIPNFQYLNGSPMEKLTDGTYQEYPEIAPDERFAQDTDAKYTYILGNNSIGYFLYANGLATNSTLSVSYIRNASTMATLTDICEVPDPEFVTSRVISYVLQARNDERFPIVIANGNRLLKNMISREMVRIPGGENTTPKIGVANYSIG